jgi:phage shock protein A
MSEAREKLKATVDELHAELDSMDSVDDEVQGLLETAVENIHQVLQRHEAGDADDATAEQQSSIVGQLSEAARHYEGRHPTLSGILGSMIDTLSNMGI